jgi:hypothetical protein
MKKDGVGADGMDQKGDGPGGGKFGFGHVILLKHGSDVLYRQQNV